MLTSDRETIMILLWILGATDRLVCYLGESYQRTDGY